MLFAPRYLAVPYMTHCVSRVNGQMKKGSHPDKRQEP
jgi:hypothetical protein